MKSTGIKCPKDKQRKLELSPICQVLPCQSRRKPLIKSSKRIKKLNSKNIISRRNTKSKKTCCSRTKNNGSKSDVPCQHTVVSQSCAQELINLCWVLLTPDCVNHFKELLNKNHGYKMHEAEEWLNAKQTQVLERLRLMTINGMPFVSVMDILLGNTMCQNIQFGSCCSNGLSTCQPPQSQFEKLVTDVRNEASRNLYCAARYRRNNTPLVSNELFNAWKLESEDTPKRDYSVVSSYENDDINYGGCLREDSSKNLHRMVDTGTNTVEMKIQESQNELRNVRTQSVQTDLTDNDIAVPANFSPVFKYPEHDHFQLGHKLDQQLLEEMDKSFENSREVLLHDLFQEKLDRPDETPFGTPICDESHSAIFYEARNQSEASITRSSSRTLTEFTAFTDRGTTSIYITRRPSYEEPTDFHRKISRSDGMEDARDCAEKEEFSEAVNADAFKHIGSVSGDSELHQPTLDFHLNRNLELSEFVYEKTEYEQP